MNDLWIRILMAVNILAYRLTGGRLGSRMAGQDVLLLHTVGRKTGKTFVTPINYYRDGAAYVVVASNWGKPRHPGWYFNLMHRPQAEIQVDGRTLPVQASQAGGDEYARLWLLVTTRNPFYPRYQQQTDRQIPLVILNPTDASNA
jgi:deazaflavin-dependent oxidoreductase (nitroreductase family)